MVPGNSSLADAAARGPGSPWAGATRVALLLVAVLAMAPEEGLGVTNPEMRERLLPQITLYRRFHG